MQGGPRSPFAPPPSASCTVPCGSRRCSPGWRTARLRSRPAASARRSLLTPPRTHSSPPRCCCSISGSSGDGRGSGGRRRAFAFVCHNTFATATKGNVPREPQDNLPEKWQRVSLIFHVGFKELRSDDEPANCFETSVGSVGGGVLCRFCGGADGCHRALGNGRFVPGFSVGQQRDRPDGDIEFRI